MAAAGISVPCEGRRGRGTAQKAVAAWRPRGRQTQPSSPLGRLKDGPDVGRSGRFFCLRGALSSLSGVSQAPGVVTNQGTEKRASR